MSFVSINARRDTNVLFFHQNKTKELACLCFLKDIELDPSDLENGVNELRYEHC